MSISYSETNLFPKGEGLRSLGLIYFDTIWPRVGLRAIIYFSSCKCQGKVLLSPSCARVRRKGALGSTPKRQEAAMCNNKPLLQGSRSGAGYEAFWENEMKTFILPSCRFCQPATGLPKTWIFFPIY